MTTSEVAGSQAAGAFPAELFDAPPSVEGAQWWAIYTKARQEKALAADLRGWGISHFLPLLATTKVYRRNRVTREVPLFPGYVFLLGTDDDRVRCLTTNRVSKVLDVPEPATFQHDLSQLHQLIESGASLTVEERLSPGTRVRIKRGALTGIEGVVLRRRSETRLLVSVHFLQRGASVAVEEHMLEAIDRRT